MSDFKIGRTPDYYLKAARKVDGKSLKGARVGVAWLNKGGSIGIRINEFVRLPVEDGDIALTLFPWEKRESEGENESGD